MLRRIGAVEQLLVVSLTTTPVGERRIVHMTMMAVGQPSGDQARAKRRTNGSLDSAKLNRGVTPKRTELALSFNPRRTLTQERDVAVALPPGANMHHAIVARRATQALEAFARNDSAVILVRRDVRLVLRDRILRSGPKLGCISSGLCLRQAGSCRELTRRLLPLRRLGIPLDDFANKLAALFFNHEVIGNESGEPNAHKHNTR